MKLEEIKIRFEEEYSIRNTVPSSFLPHLNRAYNNAKQKEWNNVVLVLKRLNMIDDLR